MLLVDTNIWLAAGDRRARRHHDCARLIAEHAGELAAPAPVIAETGWLLLDRGGPAAQAGFVAMITTGRLEVLDLTDTDWRRVLELIDAYADLPLDLIDASIVAVAERLDLTTIATLDHRDFRVVRPAHCDAFDLVP
ncbi:MAG: type II toxin-antitoxin system VapC family toxin [Acidimicrobiales bacterium]